MSLIAGNPPLRRLTPVLVRCLKDEMKPVQRKILSSFCQRRNVTAEHGWPSMFVRILHMRCDSQCLLHGQMYDLILSVPHSPRPCSPFAPFPLPPASGTLSSVFQDPSVSAAKASGAGARYDDGAPSWLSGQAGGGQASQPPPPPPPQGARSAGPPPIPGQDAPQVSAAELQRQA